MKKQNGIVHSYPFYAIGIIVIILLSGGPAFSQLIVQPMRIDLTPRPGRRINTSFELQNYDPNGSYVVSLSLVDLSQWEDSTWRVIEPNDDFDTSTLASCKDWITMDQTSVTVGAMRIIPVKLSLRIPPGVRGFRAAGIIATLNLPPDVRGVGVIIQFLVPVILDIQQGRAMRHRVELRDVGMEFSEPNGLNPATTLMTVNIVNNGETFSDLKALGRVRGFSNGHWKEITTTEFKNAGIIPGAKLRLESDLGRSLPSGKYKVAAGLYVDGRRFGAFEKEIDFTGDPSITKMAGDVALTIEPTVSTIEAIPGATRTRGIRVTNDSDEAVDVRTILTIPPGLKGVAFGDFVGDDLDCSKWIEIKPEKFTVRRGRGQNIRITATMPNTTNMQACYYAQLTMYATYPDGQNAGVKTAYICVKNNNVEAVPAAQPLRLNIPAMEESRYLVVASFGNFGNIHFTPRCTAAFTRITGASIGREILLTSSRSDLMLPLEFRSFSGAVDLANFPSDMYYVTASLEYAPGQTITKQIPIRVSLEGDRRVVDIIQPERPGEKVGIELNR
jgi:hypothetical protein